MSLLPDLRYALRAIRRSPLFATVAILEDRGYKLRYGIQASAGRNNDDRQLYARRGVADQAEDFGLVLASEPAPSVILAGRLHAALEAIAAGYPAIHIGYERKSAGAFGDLGLADYTVDAWTGSPEMLADRVQALAADPGPYWDRVGESLDSLALAWHHVRERVAEICLAL